MLPSVTARRAVQEKWVVGRRHSDRWCAVASKAEHIESGMMFSFDVAPEQGRRMSRPNWPAWVWEETPRSSLDRWRGALGRRIGGDAPSAPSSHRPGALAFESAGP